MALNNMLSSLSGMNLLRNDSIPLDYMHDELAGGVGCMPEAVVEVKTADEVSAVMKLCAAEGVAVTVRGAGTGKAGGSVAVKGGVVLSVKGMNQILDFDEAASTLTVQPGVLLQDVKAEAAKHGLCYPPDPGEQTATVGGKVRHDEGLRCRRHARPRRRQHGKALGQARVRRRAGQRGHARGHH